MRAFVAVLFVVSCAGHISASGDANEINSESPKQEKRSLSHGIGNGYYSAGLSDGGYVSSGPLSVSSGPSISSSGPSILSGGSGILSSGPGIDIGSGIDVGPGLAAGPGIAVGSGLGGGPAVVAGASAVGVSTNTNTFTTVRENVPVGVPVDRPIPV